MEGKPRELYRMPLNTDEWRKMTQLHTLEEKGALLEACLAAWAAPLRSNPPATIPDDVDALEALFGRKLAKVEPVIRQHFRPCADHPGFLRCAWLLAWYDEALKRYDARARGGRKAAKVRKPRPLADLPLLVSAVGDPYAERIAERDAERIAEHHAQATQPKPNGVLTPHTGASLNARAEEQPRQLNHNPPDVSDVEVAKPEAVGAMLRAWRVAARDSRPTSTEGT